MPARAMSLEQYLGHTTRAGGGSKFMKSWKNREADGDRPAKAIRCFMHTRAPMMAVWQHGIPRIVTRTKDNITTNEVWGGTWNCIEPDEDTLKRQYFRDRETNGREYPPTVCPVCIMLEVVRRMVERGELKFTQPIFRWEGDDPAKADVLTAAGIYNGYKGDLTRSQKMAMKKAGISLKDDAWKQNMFAKCNYVLTVVDVEHVDEGIQIATETTLLGDKIKEAIRDRMTAEGADDGNPMKNPVCFQWEYRPKKKQPQDKYHALVLPRIKLTPEIRELIITKDPPSKTLETICAPGNIAELRADLEAHCLVDNMPWDEIFGPAEELYGDDSPEDDDDDDASEVGSDPGDDEPEEDDDDAPESGPQSVPQPKDSAPDEDEIIACDVCKGQMLDTQDTCPHCGTVYDMDSGDIIKRGTPTSEEPKPKKRRRKKKAAKKRASKSTKTEREEMDEVLGDDDIPF